MMVNTSLNVLFFSAAAVKKGPGHDITKRELIVLTALNITRDTRRGESVTSLHRFCEKHGHAWKYRNFKKLMDGLEQKSYVVKKGLYYSLTVNAIATLVFIDRKLKKLLEQATSCDMQELMGGYPITMGGSVSNGE